MSKTKTSSARASGAQGRTVARASGAQGRSSARSSKIIASSTAEYFAKNLQQVGFSSPLKAVLTTLKEAVDNALDACEEQGLAPDLEVIVQRVGTGSSRNSDLVRLVVEDNGPGLAVSDVPKVFGEYLASSKFGQGKCSRGQQGIGISAATTWAQLTNASGVKVISKTAGMRQAVEMVVDVDIKNNTGLVKSKKPSSWSKPHGLRVEFHIDGRIQLKGEGGLLTYLEGTALVNPHLSLKYQLLDNDPVVIQRVSSEVPQIPAATLPHLHTMKLGEFITHAHLYSSFSLKMFLKKAFWRVNDSVIREFVKNKLPRTYLTQKVSKLKEQDFKKIFQAISDTALSNPSTKSVMVVGEDVLAKSVKRLGEIDFFSVNTRRPKICDFKPVVVEVALARFKAAESRSKAKNKGSQTEGGLQLSMESLDEVGEKVGSGDSASGASASGAGAGALSEGAEDDVRVNPLRSKGDEAAPVQLLRFANRVPLQFDKSGCAITKAVESVNWRSYGLQQSRNSLPLGPYVFAVSVTSPFIKFKNASKETIDASLDLVDELRLALMQAGQKLSRHIKRETRAADLERKMQHIEKYGPILVEYLAKLGGHKKESQEKARRGLAKILGRDSSEAQQALQEADSRLKQLKDLGGKGAES